MYVSYLLDKDMSMYPGSVRHSGINLGAQNFVSPPQYPDYTGYHVPGVNLDNHPQSSGSWASPYAPAREDWSAYAGPTNTVHAINTSPGTVGYSPTEYNLVHQTPGSAVIQPLNNSAVEQLSPNSQRRNPYQWMRKPTQQPSSTGTVQEQEYCGFRHHNKPNQWTLDKLYEKQEQRINIGWCTQITRGWSWRRSFIITATSASVVKLSWRPTWGCLRGR
eukprot:gi/632965257/ref/XP_007898800.1/ PREDICTED: homeobox protein CDX-2 isoform X2 [Callorhinchus milii]